MVEIKTVNRFGEVDRVDVQHVMALLEELAIFEKMEDDFDPNMESIRYHLNMHIGTELYASLAYDEEKPVGFVLYFRGDFSSFQSSWRACLHDIYIVESHRGQGIFRKLLDPVAHLALNCRSEEIVLEVLDWNKEAIAAYERIGAVPAGHRVDEKGRKWLIKVIRGDALMALVDQTDIDL